MKPEIKKFADVTTQAAALAEQISFIIKKSINEKDKASIVVPGGKTPEDFFEYFSEMKLPWQKIYITLTDERWVNTSDERSNEKNFRKFFPLNKGIHFTPLKNNIEDVEKGVKAAENGIKKMPKPFDAVILGMGEDGHIASLFPGTELKTKDLCQTITTQEIPRVSLSLPCLLDSKKIFVLITGPKKENALFKAMRGGSIEDMPVRAILQQKNVPVEIYWAP